MLIEDPFEAQQMLRDALKFLTHEHVKDFSPELDLRLDANAEPWNPEDVA